MAVRSGRVAVGTPEGAEAVYVLGLRGRPSSAPRLIDGSSRARGSRKAARLFMVGQVIGATTLRGDTAGTGSVTNGRYARLI
jgi:hypothetical protein